MSAETLVQRAAIAQHYLETLRQYASVSPDHQALVNESLRELDATLQELRIAAEALSLRSNPPRDADGNVTFGVMTLHDVTAWKEAEAERERAEQESRHLAKFPSENPNPVLRLAPDGVILYANEASDALLQEWGSAVGGYAPEIWRNRIAESLTNGSRKTADVECAGQVYSFVVSPVPEAGYVNLYGTDITERKRAEEALGRLNRTLRARSHSDQALMHATNEAEYMEKVCKIIVQDCGHAMVWVGLAEKDEARSVRPVAYAGFEEGYLETLHITWADTERGRGPTGTAIRTGQSSFCRNMLTDPNFSPWRAEALKRGYASLLVLPLLDRGRPFGALTIYFREPDPFTEDEVTLLSELADDLAYGIQTLRLRAAHAQAEAALRESEERFRSAFDGSAVAMALTAPDLRLLRVNPAYCKLTGFDEAELVGRSVLELTHPDDAGATHSALDSVVKDKQPTLRFEKRYICKDGRLIWVDVSSAPVCDAQGNTLYLVTHVQDITERKHMEEALRKSNERQELLAENASQLLASDEPQKIVDTLCARVLTFLDCQTFFNYFVDDEKKRLRLNASAGIPDAAAAGIERLNLGQTVCGCVARDGARIVAENIQETPDPRTDLVRSFGIQACACHPLLARGRVIGTLSFGTRTRTHFTEDELALMKAVADQVAIAMERKRAEEALRASEERARDHVARLQAVLDAAPAIIWIAHDRECRSITGNRASQELLRVPEGINVSKSGPAPELLAHYRVFKDGVELAPQDMPIQRTAALGQGFSNYAMEIVFDDGSERSLLGNVTPVLDFAGQPNGAIAAFMDITERKRVAQERELLLSQVEQQRQHVEEIATTLQRERDLLETIMENTRAQLAYLDRQFRFVRVNLPYAQGSGHRVEELIGRNHFDLFPNAENQAIFERVRDTGQPVVFHAKPFVYPDRPELGTTYWDWTLVPIKDARGRVEGSVLSLLDVTEHERAEQEREARLSRLGALVKASQHVLAETTVAGLLQRVVEAARELTVARIGTSSLVKGNTFTIGATLRSNDMPSCPPGLVFNIKRGGVYLDLIEKQGSLRLTDEQLVQHPGWWGLPEPHIPLRGLLGVRLVGSDGQAIGMIMVSHKEQGDFSAEDEALLTQLAALASLGLQHIEAKADAERRADELDAVFGAMTDAVAVYDAAGMAVRANPAALAIYGPDLMAVDRPTFARRISVYTADGRLATADSLPTIRALCGEKVTNEYLTLTDPNGRDHVVLASASPLLTNGNVSGAVAVWHDVTEREHIMTQLENERARLRAIIENAPEAIVVTDQQCRVILANPAAESLGVRAALNHPAESQVQCEVRYPEGTPGDSSESPLARSVLEGRTLKNIEMAITYSNGEHRVFLGSTAPIKDRLGKMSSAVGVFEDITQREQMEKALEQSNRDMLMLNRLGQELGATLDLSQVLGRILEAVNALVPAEDNAIWLWDEERSGWLVCRAALSSHPEQSPVNMRLRAGEGITGWVAEHRESVAIPCVAEDPRLSSAVYAQTGYQARSILAVPLFVRDKVTGVLTIINRSVGEFDARDRTLVETLAASAAIAVENARLHDQAMQAAVTAERSRLARDLHDAVSQTLFSASVISETLPRLWKRDPSRVERGLEQLYQLTRGALAEMRALLVELRPATLVETDLGDLLHQLGEATMSRTRITVSVAIEGKRALPPEVQIALYRIAQEALNNVVKHARASQVTLSLLNRPEQVELRVKDDGRGFDPDHVTPGHLGLSIMRERAQSIGITLEIASQPGQGAEIVATCACTE